MKELSQRLAAIPRTGGPDLLKEAKQLIIRLQEMNRRWNIEGLNKFLIQRQRDLFF
ncbi:MAG: hypothetical protein R6X10_00180 [Desulfobacterales bacterium]